MTDSPEALFHSSQAESELLRALSPLLGSKAAVEVGAGNGELTRRLLEGGYRPIHVMELSSDNAVLLRTRFGPTDNVAVHDPRVALSNGDPAAMLAVADIPANVGLLRVDAGQRSYNIVEAAGEIRSDLVIVRHWRELSDSFGKCPWTLADMTEVLAGRGFSNFMSIGRRDHLTTMEWNRATLDAGESSVVVFFHDRVVDRLMPVLLDALSRTHETLWDNTRLAKADAARSSEAVAALRADQAQTSRRISAMAEALPPPFGVEDTEGETTLVTTIAASRQSGDPLERLERRVRIRTMERERLLQDRKTSLRAWRWRAKHWGNPRIGVLWQEEPRPLTVPRSYLRITAPKPAPSISIVTPSFQQGRFLDRTIGSVVSQRYPNLEYIVQDGGSSDETQEVLARNEDSLAHWESTPDGGQANGINLGFSRSSGEIMAYLNSDDILLPGSLAFIARFFEEHPEVDVVYGHRILIDANDARIGVWVMPPHDDELLMWADCIPQETLFWRRGIWDAAGGEMDESFRFAVDWDLLLRFIDRGAKIVRLNRYLGAFRVHPEQKTTASSAVGDEETRRLWRRCHGREVEWDEALSRLQPYLRQHVLHHTLHRAAERLPWPRVSLPHAPSDGMPARSSHRVTVDEPLRVAVNLRQYLGGQMGGTDVYVRNILKGMAIGTKAVRPLLTVFTVESQVDSLRALAPDAVFEVVPDHRSGLSIESEFEPDAHDALYCPLFVLDPVAAGIPGAIVIPDLQHEFFSGYLDAHALELRRRTYRVSAAKADTVFTVSEFSKRTMVEMYGLDPGKIVVTYLDVDEEFRGAVPIAPSSAFVGLALPDEYLFYPASFHPHKNHATLLQALKILARSGRSTLGLVLSGPAGIGSDWLADEIGELGMDDQVRVIGYQPREVTVELCRHARALVFPSRFEGFGLPLLEAFHTRTPVIASRVSSCPEIAGDAAIYIDENDPADMAAAVERLLTDSELELELIERGKQRAKQFSWEQSVELVIEALVALTVRA